MRAAWVMMGMAGLGVPASGQNKVTGLEVSLTFDRTSIGIGETATATMTASWLGPPGSYMSIVAVDLMASGAFVMVSDIAPVAWNNPALGFNGQGVASGADVLWLNASQFNLIPPYTTENPILITTFTVTGAAEGLMWYRSVNSPGAPFPYQVQPVSLTGPIVDWTNDVFESQTLVVTPGPGVVGVLGMAGVIGAGRRRR
jgi:hypothetical protein